MNRIFRVAGLLLCSLLLVHCQKELSFTGSSDNPTIPAPLTATLQGNITDENDLPAAGVAITVGSLTAVTDAAGYFRIPGASLDQNTSLVTAAKAGYFKSCRVFSATSGTNQVYMKLLKKTLAATVSATSGGNATLSNGAAVSLPANGIVLAGSGAAYTGDVKVYAAYIDPQTADIVRTVPGSFMAMDKNGKRVILASTGMLAVELESAGGEKLQIKDGATATLTIPVSAAASTALPASIALWYVDEQTGIWKEEGSAVRQGNSYTGQVKHFSFWNCDRPFAAVSLTIKLQTADGHPLEHAQTKLTDLDSAAFENGVSDSLGWVKGMVPANHRLLLEVLDPCDNVVYSQSIGMFSKNTELAAIKIPLSTASMLTLSGKLVDCSSQPVKAGYVFISYNNVTFLAGTDSTGKFSTSFMMCNGNALTAQVIGVNKSMQQQGSPLTVTISKPATNAGNISTCDSSSRYINYLVDGISYSITANTNDSLLAYRNVQGSTNELHISGTGRNSSANNIEFVVRNATGPGTYPLAAMQTLSYKTIRLLQPFTVTFTSFAKVAGEFFEGSCNGQFTADSATTIHTLNSYFKVRSNF